MTNTEKYLSLEINSEAINYYIKWNDVKVHNETGNSPVKQTVPINQWILNGDNTLLVSVNFENEDKGKKVKMAKAAKLTVSLVLTEYKDKQEFKHTISTFNLAPSKDQPEEIASSSTSEYKLNSNGGYNKDDNGDITIGKWTNKHIGKWIRFTQTININIGVPEWAYLSADNLGDAQKLSDDDYYALLNEVYQALEDIWALMQKKDLEAILKLTQIRSHDFDGAYYLKPGSKQKEMEESLKSAFEHKDLYLDELVAKNRANLKIEANGKIARLEVQQVGGPMMFYSHKDDAFTRYYDFYFMKKNGKLIIIR